MQRTLPTDHYGKRVFVAAAFLMWLLILVLFATYGYENTWRLWNVPALMPPFMDLRHIPGSAESFRRGFEPTLQNPSDPAGRLFNYPVFWRLFFYSGVTQADVVWIGIVLIVVFFCCVSIFPHDLTIPGAVLMLLVVFSPACMLLYERGNVDLIVFSLCVAIVLAGRYPGHITAILLMAGTVIKLFPFFGISVLLRESKTTFTWLSAACFGALLLYASMTWGSLVDSWTLTQRGTSISYGARVFTDRYDQALSRLLAVWFNDSQVGLILGLSPIVFALILILIAGRFSLRHRPTSPVASEKNLAAFRVGASIYVGTFLLGNNWDYRLTFLLLVVPQLVEWTRSSCRDFRRAAVMDLFAILASCWHFVFWYSSFLNFYEGSQAVWFAIDELLNWMLVPGLGYLLIATLPDWAQMQLRMTVGRRVAT